jgi:hypothetical protein
LIRHYFRGASGFLLGQLLPSRGTLAAYAAASAAAAASERALLSAGRGPFMQQAAAHVAVGVAAVGAVAASAWRFERGTVAQIAQLRRSRGSPPAGGGDSNNDPHAQKPKNQ